MNAQLKKIIEKDRNRFEKLSDIIWDYAEVKYQEYQSSRLLADFLEKQGFLVERKIGDIPTAFRAKAGEGKPVIAFLGEYDALPGMSQEADVTEEKRRVANGAGHGCGHNLLGVGAMEAACALKTYLEQNHLPGTVVYFGCPAEEGGAGKAFMIRSGCFEGIDFAFTWHPAPQNGVWTKSLANAKVIFRFHGKSAHASSAPQNGRSALDACELMNVGVNYLREHVSPETRMHYAYLDSGGTSPNIVPKQAALLYALRAPTSSEVEELLSRVTNVAKGAALMTETHADAMIISAYRELLNIPEMEELMLTCIQDVLPVRYTEEELDYARRFQHFGTDPKNPECISRKISYCHTQMGRGSTDVGDVSWKVPTGNIFVATMAVGSVMHGWTATAQGKSAIAHKGMHTAAKILAEAGRRVLEDEKVRKRILEGFARKTGNQSYHSLIPLTAKPSDI